MDSPSLNFQPTSVVDDPITKSQKIAMARRAIRSLIIVILANLSFSATIILLFSTGQNYQALSKPIWYPPLSMIHLATLGSSFLMGLASWLVWADGGFRPKKGRYGYGEALPIYISQIWTSMMWHPLVLQIGSTKFGWFFSLANFGLLVACYDNFKKVNPIAGALVKPALAWAAYLLVITCHLLYL